VTRPYPTQVSNRQVLGGVLVALLLAAGVVGLSRWLVLPGRVAPELRAATPPAEGPDTTTCSLARAQPAPVRVSAGLLTDCAEEFDGQTVAYEGEVVESLLPRGERVLATLNDDPYSGELGPLPEHRTQVGGNAGLSVSLPASVAATVTTTGSYRAQGDRLAVVGTFRRADPAAGGAPLLTADQVLLAQRGRLLSHSPSTRRIVVAALLTAATLAVLWTHRRGIHIPGR
jgi:hypothetical protein